jgi:hypothetical protein
MPPTRIMRRPKRSAITPAISDAIPQVSACTENRCATAGSVVDRSRLIRFRNGAMLAPADVTRKTPAHSAISIHINRPSVM